MTVVTTIEEAEAIDLTGILRRENIDTIRLWPQERISVALNDGWFGIGATFGEALDEAKLRHTNIRHVP